MDKRTKIIIGGASALVLGVGAYFFVKNKKKKQALLQLQNNSSTNQSTNGTYSQTNNVYKAVSSGSGSGSNSSSSDTSRFPLKFGMKNNSDVKKLQQFLNIKLGESEFPAKWITGNFLEKTQAAVKKLTGNDTVSQADLIKMALKDTPFNKVSNSLSIITPFTNALTSLFKK